MRVEKLFVAVLLVTALSPIDVTIAKNCTTGKACGNTCISKNDVCHADTKAAKTCKTGKLCGDSCIPMTSVCHKGEVAKAKRSRR